MLKIASLRYTGPTSIFLRVLLNKKYALPNRIIDKVVGHFMQMMRVPGPLPVVWHQVRAQVGSLCTLRWSLTHHTCFVLSLQCLLTFVQRYKRSVTREQRELFRALMKKHIHHLITPEVRRELFSGPARGEVDPKAKKAAKVAASTPASVAGAAMAPTTRPRVFVWNRAQDSQFANAPTNGVASVFESASGDVNM